MHPERTLIFWAVRLGFGALLLWLVVLLYWVFGAQFDRAVLAVGQLELDRPARSVAHISGGKILHLYVDEGDHIQKGQVLFELDAGEKTASYEALLSQHQEVLARLARLRAERDGLPTMPALQPDASKGFRALYEGQLRLFAQRRKSFDLAQEQTGIQIAQAQAQIKARHVQISSLNGQKELLLTERITVKKMLNQGLVQSGRLNALELELLKYDGDIGELEAQLAQLESQIAGLKLTAAERAAKRVEDAIDALRNLDYRAVEQRTRLEALKKDIASYRVHAPVSGRVHAMNIHTDGAILAAGQEAFTIIPEAAKLTARLHVATSDIDQIYQGQEAMLYLRAFDTQTTQPVMAKVTAISADAYLDEASQNAFYQIELSPSADGQDQENWQVSMPIEAHLKTSQQSFGAYLIEPIKIYFSRAFREG